MHQLKLLRYFAINYLRIGAKKNIVDRMLIGTNVLLDYLLPLTQAVSCQDIDDVEQDKLVS